MVPRPLASQDAGGVRVVTIMIAPYFSARSHKPGSGPMSPSMEKTPSLISSFLPAVFHARSRSSAWRYSCARRREFWRVTGALVNNRGVVQLIEMMKSSLPSTADTVPALAANPDWKTTQASTFLSGDLLFQFHVDFHGSGDVRTAPDPTPYLRVASRAASRSLGCVVRPR